MIKTILLPTDLSPGDTKVVQQAAALARVFEAKLTLLHIIDVNDPSWLKFAGSADDFMRQLRTKAHSEMDHLVESVAGEPIAVGSLIVEGMPWEEIAKRTRDFDLVIMGQPRPKPFWRLFSKRTAQRVVDRAECGVLLVEQ
jgi:nucleotide-binding universal stress UspA family protein